MEEQGLREKKFFGGDRIGIVDIAFGTIAHWFGVIEEIIEVKVLEAHALPRLHAWKENFEEVPIIKENLPDQDKISFFFKKSRAGSTNLEVLGKSFKWSLLLYLIINSYIFSIKIYFSYFLRGKITN